MRDGRTRQGIAATQEEIKMADSITTDAFYDGDVLLIQPQKGFRAGIDSVFLASSLFPETDQDILDVGCGVGTVGLLVLSKFKGKKDFRVTGIEKVPSMVNLAKKNSLLNKVEASYRVFKEDVLNPEGFLKGQEFHHVVTNPPFFFQRQDKTDIKETALAKRQAKSISPQDLVRWMDFCIKRLRSGGTLTIIIPPERLEEILQSMKNKMGRIRLCPLWGGPDRSAKRLLIQAKKNAKTPLVLLPGILLKKNQGGYSCQTEKILRTGQGFSWGEDSIKKRK